MGLEAGHPDDLATISDSLLRAPVVRYNENGYLVRTPGSGQKAEGKISLAAARKVLGANVSEEDEVVVRLLEAGSSPESAETYDATLEVYQLPDNQRESIPDSIEDPLMIQKTPDGFECGKNYDFTVLHHGSGEYIVADPESIKRTSIER
ncbi:hypothetical protein LC1Nh_0185 [Candidatus Nanohalobium constans]|uniref:Uncharacterized protein n=2 Tax=Candidatus Nanohalobium constans TaxID=2565781 RepID=A0A5Q0UFW1_9ARCH|nr:hypothetical protein LC1Nh_0185 [Candidatus Nanohalobium constans]